MSQLITGIHHVTAIASDAQKNIDFYTGVLGLRLVKNTINFDGPDVYHFYYGNESGTPGSILTFFPYQGLVNGHHGKGALNTTTFSLPADSLNYWLQRFRRFGVAYKKPQERFDGEVVIYFEDEDGLGLELVFSDKEEREGFGAGPVPLEHAIRGFYNVEIRQEGYERTAALLTEQLDHKLVAEKSGRFRFAATDAPGNYVDILCAPDSMNALAGSGTVHHLAFATPNKKTQEEIRRRLVKRVLDPSPILDRAYFTSVYFREPGGVLFEIATEGPGFTVDEQPDHLGEALQLPPQFSSDRASIESKLVPVTLNAEKYR